MDFCPLGLCWNTIVQMRHDPVVVAGIFALGACVGSFLNVCIYRIPLDRSIITPGSQCAACGAPIPAQHNIPIASWFLLRGRAACCGTRIDARYWMVELLTGLLFVALWWKYPPALFAAYALFTAGLIAASGIDLDHFIIPDRFTLGGCVAGLVCSALVPALHEQTTAWTGLTEGLRGAAVGAGALGAIAWVGRKLFGQEAMGMGDVKLMAAFGSFLGAWSTAFILPVSSLIGSVVGLTLMATGRSAWKSRIPYGPFLAAAAILWMLRGREWTDAYLAHVRSLFI